MKLNPQIKYALDFLPLVVFFVGYKWFGLFEATMGLMVATLITLAIIYIAEKKIALLPLITAIFVSVLGGLTLYTHNEIFIKIKPTLINLIFAAILLVGCYFKKGLLSYVFGAAFKLTDRGWWLLSKRFGLFFLLLAGLNELVWRNFPTDIWVDFKVFGLMGLTMIFTIVQAGFILKHQQEES